MGSLARSHHHVILKMEESVDRFACMIVLFCFVVMVLHS